MSREQGIKFSVERLVNTDCKPYQFIIYKPLHEGTLIIEDPFNGQAFKGPFDLMSKYVNMRGVSTPWRIDAFGNYIRFEEDQMYQLVNILEETKWYWFTMRLRGYAGDTQALNNLDSLNNFYVDKLDGIIHVLLPLFPSYMIFTVREDGSLVMRRFFMKINNNYYTFPYGNTRLNGSICLGKSLFRNTNDAFIQLIDATANNDLQFQLKNITLNHNIPHLMNDNNQYSMDEIERDIQNEEEIELMRMLYFISNSSVDYLQENVDNIFKPTQNPWSIE